MSVWAVAAENDCPPLPKPLSAEVFSTAQRQARDRGFLWQVSKDGQSSYLYGTLHVGRETWLAAGPALEQALRASTTLALELNPLDPAVAARMAQVLARTAVRPLEAGARARLHRQLQAQCMPLESVNQVPVELLLAGVSLSLARREGLDAQFGSESFLAMTAHARGMPVVSLETVELQLKALLAADDEEARQMLTDGLRTLESGHARESLLDLVAMWEAGDVQRLDTYAQWCECVVTPMEKLQMQRLLDERNPPMARQIDALHRSGARVLAAVGSLHMSGPRGLPALLARMGYVVQRLP
nr:TraB/GumN family protein [uncultured Rhodoferax sp.]